MAGRRLLGVAAALLLAAAGAAPVRGAAVSLSPLFFSYHLDPGATQGMDVAVSNPGTEPLELRFESDVYPSPGDGSPLPRSRSLEPWLYGPSQPLTLNPGETVSVPVQLRVPAEAAVGSYYGILAARVLRPSGGIAVAGRVAAVVLVNVGSPLDSSGRIVSLDLERAESEWRANVRYENTGNAHFVPSGTLRLRSWPAGVRQEVTLSAPPILPGTTRSLTAAVARGGMGWGLVFARATVADGNGVVRTARALYVPPSAWAALALLTAAVAGCTMYVRKRKRNRIDDQGT